MMVFSFNDGITSIDNAEGFVDTMKTLTRHTNGISKRIQEKSRYSGSTPDSTRIAITHTETSRHRSTRPFEVDQMMGYNDLMRKNQMKVDEQERSTYAGHAEDVSLQERQSFLERVNAINKKSLNIKQCIVCCEDGSDYYY